MSLADELKAIAALSKELQQLTKENEVLAAELLTATKGRKPIDLFGDGCLKDYADAVKKSGGLTTMRPTVVKALEAVANEPVSAAVKAAQDGLKKHAADVEKENAATVKSDPKKAKQVKTFVDALDSVGLILKKQATID